MAKALAERTTARDWLEFCAEESALTMGDEPIVLISYAGEDLRYVEKLRKHLDVALSRVKSAGRTFAAWDYARHGSGTSLGGHFPTEIARQMWRCRAAVVFFSPDYVQSPFCRDIELPVLLWRMRHYGMRLFILRLNSTVLDNELFELPDYRFPPEKINLLQYTDDRNPSLMNRFDEHSEMMLKELESERPDKAEARLVAYARAICELLTIDEQRRLREMAGGQDFQATSKEADPADRNQADDNAHPKRVQELELDPNPARKRSFGLIVAALILAGIGFGSYSYLNMRPVPTPTTPPPMRSDSQAQADAQHGPTPNPTTASSPYILPDVASAKLACELAAGSPASPAVKPEAAVPFERLDPTRLATCEKAASLDPNDAEVAFETARLLDKAGRQLQAFERYLDAYGKGSGLAANNIGILYRDQSALFLGASNQTSCSSANDCDTRAVDWFGKAIERGVTAARYNLGLMYEAQRGVADSTGGRACAATCDARAVDEFLRAAEIGDADAALHLGWLYLLGRGVTGRSDSLNCASKGDCDQKGLAWLNKSLAAGDTDAIAFAAALYLARPDMKPQER